MKKYKIIVDGQEIIKNVSPEKEKAFFEKYPNAVPVSSEPKKSPEIDQSQETKSTDIKKYEITIDNKTYQKNVALNKEEDFLKKYGDSAKLVEEGISKRDLELANRRKGVQNALRKLNPDIYWDTVDFLSSDLGKMNMAIMTGGLSTKINLPERPPMPSTYDYSLSKDFEHPTIEQMKEWRDDTSFFKGAENTLVNNLNEYYKDQPVSFVEARARRDAIRVIIKDDDLGTIHKSKVFYFDGLHGDRLGAEYWGEQGLLGLEQITNHIDRITNKSISLSIDSKIVNILKDIKEVKFNSEMKAMAEFATRLDSLQGIPESDRVIHGRGTGFFRLKDLIVANMEGSINIDGKNFSYQYLWDNRDDWGAVISEIKTDEKYNKVIKFHGNEENTDKYIEKNSIQYLDIEDQQIKNISKEIELLRSGKATNKSTVFSKEGDVSRPKTHWLKGGYEQSYEEGWGYNWKTREFFKINKTKGDNDIVNISKEEAEARIRDLEAYKQKIITDNNYVDLYDEGGNFKGIHSQWIQDPNDKNMMIKLDKNGDPTNETRAADRSDDVEYVGKIAENDLDWLKDQRRRAYAKLLYMKDIAHENIDEVERGLNIFQKGLGYLFDLDRDSFDNDKNTIARAYEKDDIFNLGGLSGREDLITGYKQRDLEYLTKLAGGSKIAEEYNQVLIDFKVLSKAIDMNVNPLEANMDNVIGEFVNDTSRAFFGEELAGRELSRGDIADGFEQIIKSGGYDPGPIENDALFKGRDSKAWHYTNLASNTVANLAPLLAELYFFKRIGGATALRKGIGRASTTGLAGQGFTMGAKKGTGAIGALEKSIKATSNIKGLKWLGNSFSKLTRSKYYSSIMNSAVVPMIYTPIEWSIAENIGEKLFADGSGLWDAHTFHVDKETGDIHTNFTFPAAMGLAGGVFGMSVKAWNNSVVKPILRKVPKPWAANYIALIEKPFMETAGVIPKAVGQGLTATGMLHVASIAEHLTKKVEAGGIGAIYKGVDENTAEGKRLREEWDSFNNWDHVISTTIAMTALGGRGVPKKIKNALHRDVLKLSSNTEASIKATKDLKMEGNFKRNKDNTWEKKDINKAERDIIKKNESEIGKLEKGLEKLETENKELQDKIKGKTQEARDKIVEKLVENQTKIETQKEKIATEKAKIKNVKFAAEQLRRRNEVIELKKGVKGAKARQDYLIKNYTTAKAILNGNKSGADFENLYEINTLEFESWLLEQGIPEGSRLYEQHMYVHNTIRYHGSIAKGRWGFRYIDINGKVFSKTLQKKWQNYVSKQYQLAILKTKIETLKHVIKENPNEKDDIKEEIKELTEIKKNFKIEVDKLTKKHETDYNHKEKIENDNIEEVLKAEKDFPKKYTVIRGRRKYKDRKGITADEVFRDKVNEESRNWEIKSLQEQLNTGSITKTQFNKGVKDIMKTEYWNDSMMAFTTPDGKRSYVNRDAAMRNWSLSEGLHEVTHMLLKNYFKESAIVHENKAYNNEDLNKLKDSKNKKKNQLYKKILKEGVKHAEVISKKGIKVIDHMLTTLTPEEFKIVQDRIDKNYKWEFQEWKWNEKIGELEPIFKSEDGKKIEVNKFEYYEEYITVLGQKIKDGEISKTVGGLGRRLGKAFWPVLKRNCGLPNAYEFDINQTDSRKAGEDLLKFIETISTEGLTESVLKVGRTTPTVKEWSHGGFGEGIKNKSIAQSKDIYNLPEFRDKPGTLDIKRENEQIVNEIKEYARKNNIPLDKTTSIKITETNPNTGKKTTRTLITYDAVTPEFRTKLAEKNDLIAHWASGHPMFGGKGMARGITGEGLVTRGEFYKSFKDMLSDNIARTFNPSLGIPFGTYAFSVITKRYPKILDTLRESKHARLYTKEGKTIDVEAKEDIYEALESEDLSPSAMRKAREMKVRDAGVSKIREVKATVETSRLRTEIGIKNIDKAEIIRSSEAAVMKTKPVTEKDFEKSLTENTRLTHYYRLKKILTRGKMIEYKDVILDQLTISELVAMQRLKGEEIFIKNHGRHGSLKVIEDFMFGENKSGKNPGEKVLLPEMKKMWDTFSKMKEIDKVNSPEYIEFYRRKDAGVSVYERLPVEDAVWKKFLEPPLTQASQKKFNKIYKEQIDKGAGETVAYEKAMDAAEVGSGIRGTTREALLFRLSKSMTKDAIPEMLTPEFVEKYLTIKDIKGQIEAKVLIRQFLNKIDRSEGLQFSKKYTPKEIDKQLAIEKRKIEIENEIIELQSREKPPKKIQKLEKELIRLEKIFIGSQAFDRLVRFSHEVERAGLNSVYDMTGEKIADFRLKEKYKNWVTEHEAKWFFEEIIAKNRLFNHEGTKLTEILKALPKGVTRSGGLEQWVIEQFGKFEKLGLKVKQEVQTELGDLPDVYAEFLGRTMNIEVKMFRAQLGSLTAGVNIKKGEATPISTKDVGRFKDINKINELLEATVEGWVKLREYYKRLSDLNYPKHLKVEGIRARDKKLLANFDFHNSAIPKWAFELALKAGMYKNISKDGKFSETLIEDMYTYKPHSSSHIFWLGRGLLHFGKNKHGLDTQKLTGEFQGIWRHGKSSVSGITTKHEAFITKENPTGKVSAEGLIRTDMRFTPTALKITNPNSKINFTPEGIKAFEKSLKNPLTVIASKSIENVKRKVVASKAIENIRDLVTGKKKKRGMSTFDFDDTLARTKSGVQYTMENPSGKPAPQKKVIFLAGGPGSGKSSIIKQLGLIKQGFKIVNGDIALEWLSKNHGLPTDMRDFTPEQASKWSELGWEARSIAQRKETKFRGRGDGVIIDGTGANKISLLAQMSNFKQKGYDVQMVFVETSLDIALARNRARKERSLKSHIVVRTHKSVQENKKAFKEEFGDNFVEINTNNLKQGDPVPTGVTAKMDAFTKGYKKGRITAEEFANKGAELESQGAKFDFSEFSKVVEGEPGPYLQTAINRAKKYGTKNMFVLTARPQDAAHSIHVFLTYHGLKIPIKNITGLANSTGEAKAKWMLEKFAEGYNDMYFVDDAFANVKAVKEVLSQLDIKSKVVQAKIQQSKDISLEINKILERKSKFEITAGRKISLAEAKAIGRGKGRFDYFVPPSAEDLKGLMYKMLGKGRQGDADMRFFKKSLFDPFAVGIRDLTIVKQKMSEEYKTLKKKSKDIGLTKTIKGTPFTVDQAIRIYLWEKAGFDIPGISGVQKRQLVDHVSNNSKLVNYANTLGSISRMNKGYLEPSKYWMVENIASDLNAIVRGQTRKNILAEWIDNKNLLFSPDNMNKIEAIHGKWYRESLEHMLYRMETGTNRLVGIKDGPTKDFYDWINGSVGATMFWNTRSAMLQTISTVNFTNMADNNIFNQAKAFANQPQFWKDFAFIFNSPMLKQRRAGLEIDVSASELTNQFQKSGKDPRSILRYMLEKGFTPTRIADSFAIAMGGSGFYRNRYNKYIKEGLSKAKAKEKAWLDFQEIAEETQQSSRPDLISQQQAGPLGRIILAWQNTPMQMTRLMKKKLSDLVNRRRKEGQTQMQSDISNVSGILYYGAMQNIWFMTLQSGLAWMMFGSDMEDKMEKKEHQVMNGALDTLLRGTGIYGAALSTLKNTILRYKEEQEKPKWKREKGNVIVEAINLSPPIGSKVRKVWQAIRTWHYDPGHKVSKELGLRIENPDLHAISNIIEAATNIPLARIVNKANNLEEAITGNHETWQRIAMITGWNRWNVDVKDEELVKARDVVKEKKKEEKKTKSEDKKEKGVKTVRCSGRNSAGKRCGLTTETKAKTWKCFHHSAFKEGSDRDGDGLKEYRCKATTGSGRRCKNKTENKNKKCYAHQ